jgi:MFS family permease
MPTCFSSLLQECLFVLTTTFAIGQSSIFVGAAICITSYIGNDLNMTASEVVWISAGQTLSAGCFLLFFGRVADLFGRRMMFLLSMGCFSACMLTMGFATNAFYMDVFCGLSGVCSAAAVPPAIGKLGAVYEKPSRRKNRAFACFSAGNPIGFALGAFIAGVAMVVANWRAVFWVMSVIYTFFTVTAYFTVPEDVEQKKGGFNLETFRQFDFLGAFLAIAGIALFTASLTLAANAPEGWRTPYIIALLIVGLVLILSFIYWQSVFKYPLMPLSIWKDRNFTLLVTTLCLGFYGFCANGFWITLFWQRVDHSSPLMVAVRLIPMMVGECYLLIQPSFLWTNTYILINSWPLYQLCRSNDYASSKQQVTDDYRSCFSRHLRRPVQCCHQAFKLLGVCIPSTLPKRGGSRFRVHSHQHVRDVHDVP